VRAAKKPVAICLTVVCGLALGAAFASQGGSAAQDAGVIYVSGARKHSQYATIWRVPLNGGRATRMVSKRRGIGADEWIEPGIDISPRGTTFGAFDHSRVYLYSTLRHRWRSIRVCRRRKCPIGSDFHFLGSSSRVFLDYDHTNGSSWWTTLRFYKTTGAQTKTLTLENTSTFYRILPSPDGSLIHYGANGLLDATSWQSSSIPNADQLRPPNPHEGPWGGAWAWSADSTLLTSPADICSDSDKDLADSIINQAQQEGLFDWPSVSAFWNYVDSEGCVQTNVALDISTGAVTPVQPLQQTFGNPCRSEAPPTEGPALLWAPQVVPTGFDTTFVRDCYTAPGKMRLGLLTPFAEGQKLTLFGPTFVRDASGIPPAIIGWRPQ
jgi:hypothetical protein